MPKAAPAPSRARACAVCGQAGKRYRCPACDALYCSAGCCAQHKRECVPAAAPPPLQAPAPPHAATAAGAAGAAGSEDAGFDARVQVALSDAALARLRGDGGGGAPRAAALRAALRDRRLRAVLRGIDAAADRPAALAAARTQWGLPLQEVLDDMLVAVGAAKRRADGSVEFTG
jgi:hypothetical protein